MASPRRDISLEQAVLIVAEARRLRDGGMGLSGIARELDVGYEWLRRRLDPEYREISNAKVRARLFHPAPQMARVDRRGSPTDREVQRLRSQIPKDTRDFTQRFFGDPLPGRSALDRRGANG